MCFYAWKLGRSNSILRFIVRSPFFFLLNFCFPVRKKFEVRSVRNRWFFGQKWIILMIWMSPLELWLIGSIDRSIYNYYLSRIFFFLHGLLSYNGRLEAGRGIVQLCEFESNCFFYFRLNLFISDRSIAFDMPFNHDHDPMCCFPSLSFSTLHSQVWADDCPVELRWPHGLSILKVIYSSSKTN